jgi:toxin FitB
VRYLLDTNVVSELRKGKSADPNVRAWSSTQRPTSLAISVITAMELEIGVVRVERRDVDQGRRLRSWFEERVLTAFRERILEIDLPVARKAVELHVPDPAPERDALIAATALMHDLTVVTRNTSDFERSGVAVLDPWLGAE